MAHKSKTYKERILVVREPEGSSVGPGDEPGAAHSLHIDDQYVPTERHEATGRFWTRELPYQDYASLVELGRALIDRQLR